MGRAIARHSGKLYLNAHVAEALFDVLLRALDHILKLSAAGVGVAIDGFAAFPASELIDGHSGLSALDIPECLIDAAERSEEHTSELQSPMYLVCRLLLE